MRGLPATLTAVFLVSLAVSGCGAGDSSADAVRAQVRAFVRAVDGDDRVAECRLMTAEAQAQLVASVAGLQADPSFKSIGHRRVTTCVAALDAVRSQRTGVPLSSDPAAFASLKTATVKIDADHATVSGLRLSSLSTATISLSKTGDRWLVDRPYLG